MKNLHANVTVDDSELDDLSQADLERIREADKEEREVDDVLFTLAKKVNALLRMFTVRASLTSENCIFSSASYTPRFSLLPSECKLTLISAKILIWIPNARRWTSISAGIRLATFSNSRLSIVPPTRLL